MQYSKNSSQKSFARYKKTGLFLLLLATFLGVGFFGYKVLVPEPTEEEVIANELVFDDSVTEDEKQLIKDVALEQAIQLDQSVQVSASTAVTATELTKDKVLSVFVPVTTFQSVKQSTTLDELAAAPAILLPDTIDELTAGAIADALDIDKAKLQFQASIETELNDEQIAFVPSTQLSSRLKLLTFNDAYYLDSFDSGALFRSVVFEPELPQLKLETLQEENVYKVNMTGVTALTRVMQRKLTEVGDPLYFSAKIGDFLADADLTHVSNEVSFKENCPYSNTLFCSPPEFIETLKESGVDLVELTGNHNNDLGSDANTQTIELYRSLGWNTVGGGLNNEDAAKPFIADTKDSKIAFLAYNFPDSPNGGAISGVDSAGANSFDFARIETEIASAKQSADFVIVNVQYWECYAYPDGYVEYPLCDKPIGEQEQVFKKLVDLGANMVVGSSAHQPQTYEIYNGSPIYYGLGNLYFDQTSWPGTERGIVLTHYFKDGTLLQTKLTPTRYDDDLQTRVSSLEEAAFLLQRLKEAR